MTPRLKYSIKEQKEKKAADKAKQMRDIQTKTEREEVLAFYQRPDVSTLFGEYESHFAQLYDRIVGAEYPYQRAAKRMTLEGFIKGAAVATDLYPDVLKRYDLEMLFCTIINEREDTGREFGLEILANNG